MTPGARVAASWELLAQMSSSSASAEKIVHGYFRTRRYAGSGDRAAVRERVYRVLRSLASIRWRLGQVGGDAGLARHWVLADMVQHDDDAVALMSGTGHDLAPPDEEETRLADALKDALDTDPPWTATHNLPDWLGPYFERRFGDRAADEAAALNRPAALDVRVNGLRGDRDAAMERLKGEGINSEPIDGLALGLRLADRVNLMASRTFRDGWLEPQDAGSQALAAAVEATPGQTVVDLCAGAGGKTLALAVAMAGQGTLIASDLSPRRLARMTPRLARAGVEFVDIRPGKVENVKADRVFVDAPCSGTGTWRRKAYARWQLDKETLARRVETQGQLLEEAAALVKPGGRLIYATCSVLREENEDQIERFLADHAGFVRVREDLIKSPAADGCDGVYAAVLELGVTGDAVA